MVDKLPVPFPQLVRPEFFYQQYESFYLFGSGRKRKHVEFYQNPPKKIHIASIRPCFRTDRTTLLCSSIFPSILMAAPPKKNRTEELGWAPRSVFLDVLTSPLSAFDSWDENSKRDPILTIWRVFPNLL